MSGGERAGPGAVRIRRARPGDAEAITAYHHRCWVEAFTDLLEPGVVAAMDRRGRRDRWRRWLDPGSELTTMVADLAGRPVGHTTVGAGELVHLVVDPDHWRRGLGRRCWPWARSSSPSTTTGTSGSGWRWTPSSRCAGGRSGTADVGRGGRGGAAARAGRRRRGHLPGGGGPGPASGQRDRHTDVARPPCAAGAVHPAEPGWRRLRGGRRRRGGPAAPRPGRCRCRR
jgi:GNAT superfamily N-acetyltransferase